ncbi:class A beta-lactamase-related serine hydrolase [Anaerococcus sp. AGMB09787]|uniref:class A beta-lactamase-related serine hydrolase n=1 Tax=Anaerococcus sp. AGMB09787 TaxID=2922869 RepID=UPI001FAE9FFC|nr:class A beta-lactamase-related serine hydrolase [Anaerococcus sp. AGMB09787]
MKKTFKIFLLIFGLFFFAGRAYASEADLKNDIREAVFSTVDGKLDYQVHIKSLYGPSDVDVYMQNTDVDYFTSASTIKIFIGLAVREQVLGGDLSYTDEIKRDLDLALRNSDNEATNRLIDALGGFDRINQTIYKYTKSNLTQLNRYMLGGGKQNIPIQGT